MSLGPSSPTTSSTLPAPPRITDPTRRPVGLLALARGGVCRAPTVTGTGGALLPHRFTLACDRSHIGGLFSVALSLTRSPRAGGRYPPPSSCRARTFLEHPGDARDRPLAAAIVPADQRPGRYDFTFMTSSSDNLAVAAWVGDELVPTLRIMLEKGPLRCSHLGGDGPMARDLATALEIPFVDDARALARAESSATLIMNPSTTFSFEVLEAMVRASAEAGRPLLAMTPRPSLDRDQPGGAGEIFNAGPPPVPVPLFRALENGRRFVEAANTFGTPTSASVEISGPLLAGALGTRLYDAFDLLSTWFGIPTTIQATVIRTPTTPNEASIQRIFASVIYPDGRAASVNVGADGGRVHRATTLHGEGGRLHAFNGALDWSDHDGRQLELGDSVPAGEHDFSTEVSDAIVATVTGLAPAPPLETTVQLLAACEATFLSGRTGERESCEAVRQMLGRV